MKSFFIYILVLVFFLHSIAYFAYPELMYEESFIKAIKYVVIFSVFILVIPKVKSKSVFLFLVICIFFSVQLVLSHSDSNFTMIEIMKKILPYVAPFSLIILSNVISKYCEFKRVISIVTFISITVCFIEYFFLRDLIMAFNFVETAGFYRAVSIFFNPNNAGLMFFLIIYYYVVQIVYNSYSSKYWVLIILLLICINFTGSKTPLVLIPLSIFLLLLLQLLFKHKIDNCYSSFIVKCFWSILFFAIVISLILPIILDSGLFSFREITLDTGTERYEQILMFNDRLSSNFLFPNSNNSIFETFDNAYVQLWMDFGFFGLLSYMGVLFTSLLYKKKILLYELNIILVLLIAGFSLNLFYLWPTAYVLWFIVFRTSIGSNIKSKYT